MKVDLERFYIKTNKIKDKKLAYTKVIKVFKNVSNKEQIIDRIKVNINKYN